MYIYIIIHWNVPLVYLVRICDFGANLKFNMASSSVIWLAETQRSILKNIIHLFEIKYDVNDSGGLLYSLCVQYSHNIGL